MARLLRPQQVAGAADFEITHGNFEARSQCAILFDCTHSFFCIARGDLIPWQHQDGVGSPVRSAYPASQLVEIRESEAIGPVYYDGIGVRNIDATFDYGGREQDISLSFDELMHDDLQVFPGHLAVAY